jgi:hypothetical protein
VEVFLWYWLIFDKTHNVTPPVVVDTLAEDKSEMDNGEVEELDNRSDPGIWIHAVFITGRKLGYIDLQKLQTLNVQKISP